MLKTISVWKATRAVARSCLRGVLAASAGVLCAASVAHAGVVNGDFEAGDFTGWTVTHYRNNGIATFPPTQKSHLNLQPPVTAPVTQVVSTASGTPANAPDAPGQAITIPFQGSYSARVNARGNNYRASGIQQSAQMALSDVDPVDGKVHLRMAVAPVIQDGGHNPNEQAYFYVEVRNVTKGTRLFYTFNFAAQPGVPWQTVGGYQYTGWQAIDVAPGSGLLDVGDTVEVEIIAAGCNQSGHSGEVYVDSIGPFFAGLLVSATGPTTAQPSDNVAYTYTYSNNSGVMVFNSQVSATSPQIRNSTNTATLDAVFQSVSVPAGGVLHHAGCGVCRYCDLRFRLLGRSPERYLPDRLGHSCQCEHDQPEQLAESRHVLHVCHGRQHGAGPHGANAGGEWCHAHRPGGHRDRRCFGQCGGQHAHLHGGGDQQWPLARDRRHPDPAHRFGSDRRKLDLQRCGRRCLPGGCSCCRCIARWRRLAGYSRGWQRHPHVWSDGDGPHVCVHSLQHRAPGRRHRQQHGQQHGG